MKLFEKHQDIKNIFLIESNIVIEFKDRLEINFEKVIDTQNNDFFTVINNRLIKRNKECLYIYNGIYFDLIERGYMAINYINDELYYCSKPDMEKFLTLCKVVKKNKEYEFKIDGLNSILFINQKSIIFWDAWDKKQVITVDNEGKFLWNYKLPEGYKIFLVPQVVEDVLFLKATKEINRYKKVIGLDVKTGKLKWEQNYQIPYSTNNITSCINSKNNLCYGYGGDQYQIFNPVTGEVVFEKDMSKYYAKGISPNVHRNAIYNDKLWFVSGRGEKVKFGALDIASSEIDFVQDCPLEYDYQFDVPVYYKGKLYLFDTGGTLYIFERGEELK